MAHSAGVIKHVYPSAKAHAVDLYRRLCREIPRVITVYDLDMTENEVRKSVRALFDKHRNQTDPQLIKLLLEKGEFELSETVEQWKQKSHLHRLLQHDEDPEVIMPQHRAESEFLRKFYKNE